MRFFKRALLFSVGVVMGVAVALFVYRNRAPVEVNYYVGSTGLIPVWAVALGGFAVGLFLPVLMHVAGIFEFFLDRRRLVKRISDLEVELVELRNLPLTEAEIDIDSPKVSIRPLQRASTEATPEIVTAPLGSTGESEADLYPAVYDQRDTP